MPREDIIEVRARQVRVGDAIMSSGIGRVVTSKVSKDKFTYIEREGDGNAKPMRVANDDRLLVRCTVATDEETYLSAYKRAMEQSLKAAIDAYARVEKTAAEVARASAYRIDSQCSYIGSHLAAMVERDLWANVMHTLCSGNGYDMVTAVMAVVKEERNALLGNRYRGGSSSAISNTCEAYQQQAATDFLRGYVTGLCQRVTEGGES